MLTRVGVEPACEPDPRRERLGACVSAGLVPQTILERPLGVLLGDEELYRFLVVKLGERMQAHSRKLDHAEAATDDAEPSVARSASVDKSRIAAFSVFADLPAPELNELAGAMSEVEVEASAKVITLDDYGTAIFFIEQGEADVLTDSGEASQALGPGDTFGEIALLLTGQRTASVVARTPMRLLSLSGQDFERIRAHVPELERSLRQLGLERAAR